MAATSGSRGRPELFSHLLPRMASILHGAFILDRRDVSWLFAECHRFEDPAHDLAASSLGERVDEVQIADAWKGNSVPSSRPQAWSG